MKRDMQARPIYVRKPEHIKAHMLLVYLALTLICILKKKYGYGFTNEELFNSLRNYSLAVEDETTYKTLYFDEICHKLKKEMSLDIDYLYISKKTMNHIIAKSKD